VNVFVAGGTGVIGRHLVPLLVTAGHVVTGTARTDEDARRLRALGGEPVAVDVFDRDLLVKTVSAVRPDIIVHQLTALSARSSQANAELRVHGTRNLVDAALAAGTGRILAQSIAWAYAPGDGPAVEPDPLDITADEPRATTVHGVAALEATVAELAEPVLLRYGTLYGRGTWYAPDGYVADKARAGTLPADNSVTSFVHVEDAAAACVAALDWEPGPVNVCDDEPAAGTDWTPEFARCVGAPEPTTTSGRPEWARGASNRLARQARGWTPRFPSWREGFQTFSGS
jgi:nucleoside-diphosphate-sugar epimerase